MSLVYCNQEQLLSRVNKQLTGVCLGCCDNTIIIVVKGFFCKCEELCLTCIMHYNGVQFIALNITDDLICDFANIFHIMLL